MLTIRIGLYEGAKFKLTIEFDESYPLKYPIIKFTSLVYHPFVNYATGLVDVKVRGDYHVRPVLILLEALPGLGLSEAPELRHI